MGESCAQPWLRPELDSASRTLSACLPLPACRAVLPVPHTVKSGEGREGEGSRAARGETGRFGEEKAGMIARETGGGRVSAPGCALPCACDPQQRPAGSARSGTSGRAAPKGRREGGKKMEMVVKKKRVSSRKNLSKMLLGKKRLTGREMRTRIGNVVKKTSPHHWPLRHDKSKGPPRYTLFCAGLFSF